MQKLSNTQYRETFDRVAGRYDEVSNSYAVNRRVELLVSWAKGDCLEVGAGTGVISRQLKPRHKVIATDISPNMVNAIKQNLGIEAYPCDAESLPFPDASFDTVIASECIYYLNHPERFIQEARRVLRPQGRLLISSANTICRIYEDLRSVLRHLGFRHMYFEDPNRTFFSAKKLSDMLQNGGFQMLQLHKIIVLPFAGADQLNRWLERTPLRHGGVFIVLWAEKIEKK